MKAIVGLLGFTVTLTGFAQATMAQVVPDRTVPSNVTSSDRLNFTIEDGGRSGNNLFHSFSQFSIPTNGSAVFNNATDVQNIFSRVTGGAVSNIDGLIQANGTANLFLLNSNGILFGPNARLQIGGSFLGTTASSIKFADNTEFSATNPQALLTMSVPIGLQMGQNSSSQNSSSITVQGPGHRLFTTSPFAPLDGSNNPVGLQVGSDQSLILIGDEVNLSGGIIGAQGGGHLEIGSVQAGQVKLNSSGQGWVGDYSTVEQFNNIHLAQQSLIDPSGQNSSVLLQGKNISLTEGSAILMQNFGLTRSGDLIVKATGTLNLTGNSQDGRLGSVIQLYNLGLGAAGDVNITAAEINLSAGGGIGNRTYSPAPGGNVTVNVAGSIVIDGVAPANPVAAASISTATNNSKDAGDVTITADRLRILNGGSFSSLTVGDGKAGIVRANVRHLVEVAGNNPITLTPSTLVSTSFGSGNATDVLINTSKLVVRDGGIIGSSAYVTAAAGNVVINASESLNLKGRSLGSITASRIASTAEILDPATQAAYGLPPIPQGDAGELVINTPTLRITDGAYVTVKNDGPGKAGDLEINSRSMLLNNQGAITASTASGNGGDIRLNVLDSLLMRHGSDISATAGGQGAGGNLLIDAPIVLGLEDSDITASAFQGKGGNIQITTQGIIGLKYRAQLTPENDITASSKFGVNGTVQVKNVGVDPNSGLTALPVNIVDPSQQISTGCAQSRTASFVMTGRGGMANNPSDRVISNRSWSDLRAIGAEGKATISLGKSTTNGQSPTPPSPLIEATNWQRNANGAVEILSSNPNASTPQTIATCAPH
jgi:filamentous hemagglutinin family protein